MNIKNIAIAIMMLIATLARAANWTNYPVESVPASDETFLVGSPSLQGNHQIHQTNILAWIRAGMQSGSLNLTNWGSLSTNVLLTFQPASANGSNWTAVATNILLTFQPGSQNLTNWGNMPTNILLTFQAGSANLTNWGNITTNFVLAAIAAKQDHSANLDSWSALATSAKQDALGFTPQIHALALDALTNGDGSSLTNTSSMGGGTNSLASKMEATLIAKGNGGNSASNIDEFIWSDDVGFDPQCPLSTASWAYLIQHRRAILDSFICSTPFTNSATFNEARLMNYYGINCPIGSDYNLGDFAPSTYLAPIASWPVQFASVSNVDNGTALFRRRLQLAINRNRKVKIVFTGQIYTYYDLLSSSADTNSMFDGKTLVSNAVSAIYFMGGDYPNGTEFNFWSSTNRTLPGIFGLCPTNVPQYFYGDTFGRQVNFNSPPYSSIPTSPVNIINSSGFLWDEAAIWLSVLGTNLLGTNSVMHWQQGSNNVFTIGNNQWVTNNNNMYFAVWDSGGPAAFSNLMVGAMQSVDANLNFPARPVLSTNLTYYVATNGSDLNGGLSASSPFLTIQAAVDRAVTWDFGTNNVIIKIADGTYAGSVLIRSSIGNHDWHDAAGTLILQGNDSAPANVLVTNASVNHLIMASQGARVLIKSLSVGSASLAGNGNLLDVQLGSSMGISNVVIGTAGSGCQCVSESLGHFYTYGTNTIVGGGLVSLLVIGNADAWITYTNTIKNSPTFSVACIQAYGGGTVFLSGGAYTGTFTGPKYDLNSSGSIITFHGGTPEALVASGSAGAQDVRHAQDSSQPVSVGTNGIAGVTDAGSAVSGVVGEFVQVLVPFGSATNLVNGLATNLMSISLTAGDWDVEGSATFDWTSATVTKERAGISTTSQTLPVDGSGCFSSAQLTTTTTSDSITLPRKRISVSTTTTVYLVANNSFSAGSGVGYGQLSARRVR